MVREHGLQWIRAALATGFRGPADQAGPLRCGPVREVHGHVDAPVVFAAVHRAPCAGECAGAAGDGERGLAAALEGDLALWQDDRAGALEPTAARVDDRAGGLAAADPVAARGVEDLLDQDQSVAARGRVVSTMLSGRVVDERDRLRACDEVQLANAVCESFFASLKKEKLNRRSWPTRGDARNAVFAWIEGWYNGRRLHSTLGYLSPADYENRTLAQDGASLAASRLAHSHSMIKEKAA